MCKSCPQVGNAQITASGANLKNMADAKLIFFKTGLLMPSVVIPDLPPNGMETGPSFTKAGIGHC